MASVPGVRVGRVFDEAELDAAALGEDGRRLLVAFAEDVQAGDDVVARAGDGENQVEERLRARASRDAASPPSRAARRSSSTLTVGVLVRP